MDSNISKALWIGVGILFFIGVVSLGLSLFNKGRDVTQKQTDSLTNLEKTLAEAEYASYDNRTVSGAEVLSAIKNYRDKSDTFAISVTTNKSTSVYLNNASFGDELVTLGKAIDAKSTEDQIKEARSEDGTKYINPIAKFDSALRKDKNGVIAGIIFTQE